MSKHEIYIPHNTNQVMEIDLEEAGQERFSDIPQEVFFDQDDNASEVSDIGHYDTNRTIREMLITKGYTNNGRYNIGGITFMIEQDRVSTSYLLGGNKYYFIEEGDGSLFRKSSEGAIIPITRGSANYKEFVAEEINRQANHIGLEDSDFIDESFVSYLTMWRELKRSAGTLVTKENVRQEYEAIKGATRKQIATEMCYLLFPICDATGTPTRDQRRFLCRMIGDLMELSPSMTKECILQNYDIIKDLKKSYQINSYFCGIEVSLAQMVSEEEAQTILEHYDYKRKTEGKERKVAKDEIGNHYRGRLVKRKMDQEMLQHLVVEDMVEETKMEDSTLSKKRGHEEVITSSEITRDVKRLDGKVEREITTTM